LKIAFVITDLEVGGAERMLLKLITRLDRRRWQASVISLMDGGPLQPCFEEQGIPVYTLGMSSANSSLRGLRRLAQLLRQLQPDLVQGYMIHGNLCAQIAGFMANRRLPVLWGVRHSNLDPSAEKASTILLSRALGLLSRFAAHIVYNSGAGRAMHEAMGYAAARASVIPNGFDTEAFRPSPEARTEVRRELGLAPDALLIGMVGRYHPMKGHGVFLRAAAQIAAARDNVFFVIAGSGLDSGNAELVQQVANERLVGRMFLLGVRADVPRITAAFDIATLSSVGEAFPNVVGEAMACAVPCVVTDVGDAARIVDDTGVVVPVNDAQALADGWARLLDMPAAERQALGMRARQLVCDRYSLDAIVAQYEALYLKVAGAQEY
jgi:glycosyltransferase involved in cell wall biosynthesis